MFRIESIVVKRDRIVAVVRMDPDAPRFTTPAMMDQVLAEFPDVPGHPCVNARGPRFADVMDHTSIPHLLEHLVIDLQADAYTRMRSAGDFAADAGILPDGPREAAPLLVGTTKWTDRAQGLAQVQVGFFDDLVGLQAFRDASSFLNGLESN